MCSMCKQTKLDSQYAKKRISKRTGLIILQYHCKECQSKYSKNHYRKNRKKYIKKAHIRNEIVRKDRIKFLTEYFKSHPCVDCGETNPIVLEFDHVRGIKSTEISNLIYNNFDELQKEIEKCDVRCANCHRKKTAIQLKYKMLDHI